MGVGSRNHLVAPELSQGWLGIFSRSWLWPLLESWYYACIHNSYGNWFRLDFTKPLMEFVKWPHWALSGLSLPWDTAPTVRSCLTQFIHQLVL